MINILHSSLILFYLYLDLSSSQSQILTEEDEDEVNDIPNDDDHHDEERHYFLSLVCNRTFLVIIRQIDTHLLRIYPMLLANRVTSGNLPR